MAFDWKPMMICPHRQMAQRFFAAVREVAPRVAPPLAEYPRTGTLAEIARKSDCDICFLDVATNAEQAQLLIAELAPEMPVVALDVRVDADLILRCLRRGACEFLTEPTAEAIQGLFDRLERARAPLAQRPPGMIYCVTPGKTGCGASTVAAHLAVRLATHCGPGGVLLVDGDPLAASIAFLLKLKPGFHLGDVLHDWQRMDRDLWSRLTVATAGVDVLCAPENPTVSLSLSAETAAALCAFWRERYEAVVIDTPDVRVAADTAFASLSDATLLVSTNELAVLQATRRALEYLEGRLLDRSRVRLILNRYTPATGLRQEDVKKALGVDPYAILANDYEVLQAALLEGRPAAPGSRFTASIEALCRQLRHRAAAPAAVKSSPWTSLMHPYRKAGLVK